MSENYTLTPALGLYKPNYRRDSGKWGDHWNANADVLDAAFSGNFGGPYLQLAGGTMLGPLNYTATNGTTARPAQDRAADVVNVKDFGAKGDGLTDDAAAINAATAYIRTHLITVNQSFKLVFPQGLYVVNSPINLTGLSASYAGVDVIGQGAVICGRMNGGCIVDVLTSRWVRFHTIAIENHVGYLPDIGIQIGCGVDYPADYIEFHSLKVYGDFRFTPFYNLGSEQFFAYSSEFRNGYTGPNTYCMVLDGLNHWAASSSFFTVTTAVETLRSFNTDVFVGCTWQANGCTGIVWMGFTNLHKFDRCYASNISGPAFTIYQHVGGAAAGSFLDIDCHLETTGLTHAVMFTAPPGHTSAYYIGLSFIDPGCQSSVAVFGIDPASDVAFVDLRGVELRVVTSTGAPLFDDPTKWSCTVSHAYLGGGLLNADVDATHWQGTVDNVTYPGSIYVPRTWKSFPVEGGQTQTPYHVEWMQLRPAAALTNLNIYMPSDRGSDKAFHGHTVTITTTRSISTPTIYAGSAGQTIVGQPGPMSPNTSVCYRFDAPSNSWLLMGSSQNLTTLTGDVNTTGNIVGNFLISTGGFGIFGSGSAGGSNINMLGAAGNFRGFTFGSALSGTGLRWQMGSDNNPEAGSNQGANFVWSAYSDTGTLLGDYLSINRASGLVGASVFSGTYLQVGGATGPTWTTSTAAPTAAAPVGSLHSRVGGAVGATLYVSRGSGTWAAVAGV